MITLQAIHSTGNAAELSAAGVFIITHYSLLTTN